MKVSRRDFLNYCVSSAAVLGLNASVLGRLSTALANTGPHVLWLTGASCTGCSVSLANLVSPATPVDIADLLINVINLDYHINLMGAAGDLAVENLRNASRGDYILAVEGGIPAAFNGNACVLWNESGRDVTALTAVRDLAGRSMANLSIGTCASFGGVAAASPNPAQVTNLSTAIGRSTINIPGCPTHPDWIVYVIAQLLAGNSPVLDSLGRPSALFSRTVHDNCYRRPRDKAATFGVADLCQKEIGCKGPQTRADCATRRWNNGAAFCVDTNSLCIGCTQDRFPDGFAPFFSVPVTATIPQQKPLAVTLVSWDAANSTFTSSGTGKIGSQVVIRTETGSVMAATMIRRDGTWVIAKTGLASIPSRIVIQSDGASLTANVSSGTAEKPFVVIRAQYAPATNQLTVSGTGKTGSTVQISATGGPLLGIVTVTGQGDWTLNYPSPTPVPQSITAISNGVTLTAAVTGIPSGSGALAITKAEWRGDTRELRVGGTGTPGSAVQVKTSTASTGGLLGSATVNSEGKWNVKVTTLSSPPAAVVATSNGLTVTATVRMTAQTLTITKADWKRSESKLSVAGAGAAGKEVSIYNASSGALLAKTTVGSDGIWKKEISKIAVYISRVRVLSDGRTAERDVRTV